MRTVTLQGADNIRDFGGIRTRDGREVVPGLLYRGSALSGITDDDCDILFGKLGILRVIDLRCGWEREAKPDVEADGVENLHIPFYDKEKVGIEYTAAAAGTNAVGPDIACEPEDFYRSIANPLTVRQMRIALSEMFSCALQGHAVYEHCSGGKDRAGIMALLALTVLGVDREQILDDYLMTNVSRDKNYDKMMERFLRFVDGDEARAHELVISHRARPENLEAFYGAVDERYGSMDEFVRNQLGIDNGRRDSIRAACTRATS